MACYWGRREAYKGQTSATKKTLEGGYSVIGNFVLKNAVPTPKCCFLLPMFVN